MRSRDRMIEERLRTLAEGPADDAAERELAALLRRLRTEVPPAPETLRDHVRRLAEGEETQRVPRQGSPLRRAALAIAVTVVLATLAGTLVRSVDWSSGDESGAGGGGVVGVGGGAGEGESSDQGGGGGGAPADTGEAEAGQTSLSTAPGDRTTLPPSGNRAQDYRAFLRLRVVDTDDLSTKAKRALTLTRSYGGYVVSVDYDAAEEGSARLDVRIPVRRVQEALVAFSDLGTILGQNVSIADLQGQINARTRRIERLRDRVAEVRNALEREDLGAGDRERLELELRELRARIGSLQTERRGIRAQAAVAKVTLELTTFDSAAAAGPGGLEGALRDAGGILVKELALLLYVVIVAAPLAGIAALALVASRAARRRADQRLIERA